MSAAMTMPVATASPCSHSRVAGGGLDGVAEGVPEVQQRAIAGLALVAADDVGLELAGAVDGVRQRARIEREQRRRRWLSIHVEERLVEDRGRT